MKEYTVREARLRARLTQDQLAEKSGLDQTTISDFETGRSANPRLDTVRRLAKALGIRPVQLRFSAPQPDGSVAEAKDRVGHSVGAHGR